MQRTPFQATLKPKATASVRNTTARYQFRPLDVQERACWDELIAPYANRYLFHRRSWLDYLEKAQDADIRLWAILGNSRIVGYLSGGIIRKGPYRILGSPLKGWCTNFMGPVFADDFDHEAFFLGLDDLAQQERLAMVEIEQPALHREAFERHGYRPVSRPNLIVHIEPYRPDRMWERLASRARTKVRKAQRAGLTAELTTDPKIVDIFFEQYLERSTEKQFVIPYTSQNPRLLFEHLMPRDALMAICVRDPLGQVLAAALYPHDGETLYGWGRASRSDGRQFCPNELVQWTAIERAASRGLKFYNMCSYGQFFSKFGGESQQVTRWHKFYSRTAPFARTAYELIHRHRHHLLRK